MAISDQLDRQLKTLLRAAPRPGERPSHAYLTALVELSALGSGTLTANAEGCRSAPPSEWCELLDAKGRQRAILWGLPDGRHLADAHLLAESGRVLTSIVAELLEWRAGREPVGAEEAVASVNDFMEAGPLWGPAN